MSELVSNNYEQTSSNEKQKGIPNLGLDDLNSTENYISIQAKKYKEKNIGNEEWLTSLDNLINKQNTERQKLRDKISTGTTQEIKKELDIEKMIADVQKQMYEGLGINPDVGENSDPIKFVKGLVDGLVIENIDTVKTIIESGVEALIESLKGLLTVDGILAIIESLGEDISDIVNTLNNPYEGGVAIGGLGLGVLGKGMKGIKVISKTQKDELKGNDSNLNSNETKVVENDTLSTQGNLYDNPEYAFLKEYKDILGDISSKDIIGEGNNAMILRHPDNSKVIKVAKPGGSDKLDIEALNHKEFYNFLKTSKKDFKGTPKGDLLENFHIPEIKKFDNTSGVYIMEKVEGHSIKTKETIRFHKEKLNDLPDNFFDKMSDHEVDEYLRGRGLKTTPRNYTEADNMWMIDEDREFLVDIERAGDNAIDEIKPIIKIFKDKGYVHGDEHWGNFMKTPDGKTYMIDFGRSKFPK